MSSLVESSEFSEQETAMVENENDDLEEGEVMSDDEEEEEELKEIDLKNFDLFDNHSVGSSDKENLDNYHNHGKNAYDDDLVPWRRYKEEGRESVLKEKGERSSSILSSHHPQKNWDHRHEDRKGEREKSRKDTERRLNILSSTLSCSHDLTSSLILSCPHVQKYV